MSCLWNWLCLSTYKPLYCSLHGYTLLIRTLISHTNSCTLINKWRPTVFLVMSIDSDCPWKNINVTTGMHENENRDILFFAMVIYDKTLNNKTSKLNYFNLRNSTYFVNFYYMLQFQFHPKCLFVIGWMTWLNSILSIQLVFNVLQCYSYTNSRQLLLAVSRT